MNISEQLLDFQAHLCCLIPGSGTMAPKGKAKAKADPVQKVKKSKDESKKAETKATAKAKAAAAETMDKGEVSNMIGSLKASKDPAKQELLAFYKGLPRFDTQKSELLKKWKADKSCKWLGEYRESRSQQTSSTQEELSGYVTKYLGCISVFFFLCFSGLFFCSEVSSG